MSCWHGNHEDECDLCDEKDDAFNRGYEAGMTEARQTWVGLTHEEIDYQAKKDEHGVYFALGALWAEAKLKEKNHD